MGVPAALAQQAVAGLLPEGAPARARSVAGSPAGMAAVVETPSSEVDDAAPRRRAHSSTVAADVAAHLEAGLKQRR